MKHFSKLFIVPVAIVLAIILCANKNATKLQSGTAGVFYFKSHKFVTNKTIPG